MAVEVGKPAPDFELENHAGEPVRLSSFRGAPVVLYFYPKDDTPGCTLQACEIRDNWGAFESNDAVVLGVSPDSVSSHEQFREKYDLPFTLLADPDHEVADLYGVWLEQEHDGKKWTGIQRSTFVIDADGNVANVMRQVKPAEHAGDVLGVLA